MLNIEFTSDVINEYLKTNNIPSIELTHAFLQQSDLEKLNTLKTEFSFQLNKVRLEDKEQNYMQVFEALQAGEYIVLNEQGTLVYEGVDMNSDYDKIKKNAETKEYIDENNNKHELQTNTPQDELIILLNKKKELEKQLVSVNTQILSHLKTGLDLFTEVNTLVVNRRTDWAERLDSLLALPSDSPELHDSISCFSQVVLALKHLRDLLNTTDN